MARSWNGARYERMTDARTSELLHPDDYGWLLKLLKASSEIAVSKRRG
jgi:hypothetical protein